MMNMTEIQFAWNVANNYFKTHTDTNDYKTATAFCMVKNSVYVWFNDSKYFFMENGNLTIETQTRKDFDEFRSVQEAKRKDLVKRVLDEIHGDENRNPIKVCCYSVFADLPDFCTPSEVKEEMQNYLNEVGLSDDITEPERNGSVWESTMSEYIKYNNQ